MTSGEARRSASERGFVIVAVLWIILALSSLAMIFAAYLSASARALAANDSALQTQALVSASLELTAYQLALAGDQARPPRGSFRFRMDDADVLVTFISEAARIDLNFASKELLSSLFAGLGAEREAAKQDADRIVGWRTLPVPGSANEEEALYNAVGYTPRQSLFANVNELALVVGLQPALVDRALPFVTVFNGSSNIDRTIAAPEVIVALRDNNKEDKAQDPFAEAQGSTSGSSSTPDTSAPIAKDASTAKSSCYRIETAISFRDGRRTVSEVVIALGDRVEPYRVMSWQDDVPPRNVVQRRRP